MPCLFLRNVPEGTEWDPEACDRLYREIAAFACTTVEHVEVHLENTRYEMLRPDGSLDSDHGVHVFVEWFAGRSDETKELIAWAIDDFLAAHGLEREGDIAFRDYPAGSFYFGGERVAGGPPVPDETLLAVLVRDLGLSEADADLLCYLIRCYHGGGFDLSGSRELYELIKADHPRIHRAFIAYVAGWLTAKGLGWKAVA